MPSTDLLVVGAGPFGLALAAEAGHQGIDHLVVGRPMSFWTDHMPPGMLLRSASDWHLDATGDATIVAFLATRGLSAEQAEPLPRELYLEYCAWFVARKQITPVAQHVQRLDLGTGGFTATLEDGSAVDARAVVLALGMGPHRRVPAELADLLPPGCWRHTCDAADLSGAAGPAVPGRRRPAERLRVGRAAQRGRRQVGGRRAPARLTRVRGRRLERVSPVVDRLVERPRLVPPARPGRAAGLPDPAVGRGPAEGRAVARRPAADRRRPGAAAHQPGRRRARAQTGRSW